MRPSRPAYLQVKAGGYYDYSYNGMNWVNDFQTCRGQKQSPILLPATGATAKGLMSPPGKSMFSYGVLTNPKVVNNGHTLQVSIPAGFSSDVQIPIVGDKKTATGTSILAATNGKSQVSMVKATPAQFHFHTHSEHIVDGAEYPLEMHIVHFIKKDQLPACGDAGCPVVLGIMLGLTDNESEVKPALRKVIEGMPMSENTTATINGQIDVGSLLPADKTYWTYQGSLTTPPCTEGILWHVLTTPIKISLSLLTRFKEAVGDYQCPDTKAATQYKVTTEQGSSGPFQTPEKDAEGCAKLANGHNFRVVQPINGRPIMLAKTT
eukprot:GHUV01016978.1.p1 GENE.GHUV01016978.1~~GHUV01016978.1.p1  ORF type:complete len:321 (+),score=87.31 GHUV01016978.1:404-1366(+)